SHFPRLPPGVRTDSGGEPFFSTSYPELDSAVGRPRRASSKRADWRYRKSRPHLLYGGWIVAESELGQGTTIRFTLPLDRALGGMAARGDPDRRRARSPVQCRRGMSRSTGGRVDGSGPRST